MQFFSLLAPPSKEAVHLFAEKRDLLEHLNYDYRHPQEDYLLVSHSLPILAVADGVTLDFERLVENKQNYPDPSPAGEVARIFCETVHKSAQAYYDDIGLKEIVQIFKEANDAVGIYNRMQGKTDISGNPTGWFAATGSFIVLKDDTAYWASICDSFVAQFDATMRPKFVSTGSCSPYAVINGEERMVAHVQYGALNIEEGDRFFAYTDGFEHYVRNADFLKLFEIWDDTLTERIAELSEEMNLKDPEQYGHERSLAAVRI